MKFTWLNIPWEVWFPVFVLYTADISLLRFPPINLTVNINSMTQIREWEDRVRARILRDDGNIFYHNDRYMDILKDITINILIDVNPL